VRGDTEDTQVAAAEFDDEQAVQASEGNDAVHAEGIGAEHRHGPRMQELPPGRVGLPAKRRRVLLRGEDAADRGYADPAAELQQLTLDPLVSPAVVLDREPSR
jgi:hypothetical protein